MIATTSGSTKLLHWCPKRLYFHFRLSVVVAIARGQLLRARRSQKPQICLWNFDSIGHSSRDINISGSGGHIAIAGYQSLSQSLGDTFIQLALVAGFADLSAIFGHIINNFG